MQRSKQQALMFLLGAVLVGGVVGFSADRVLGHQKFASQYGPRSRFYDDLGATEAQRAKLDSIAFDQECAIRSALKPSRSTVDSIKEQFRVQSRQVLTPAQVKLLEDRRKEADARRQAREAKEPRRQCSVN
jgi:Spy/CpxP family protein refolding chaperone